MPIGSAKIGVLGAGLVPGGTQTFNASGTFTVPPGVKKVNITGKGATGNSGNAGNPGNAGNDGRGGSGGGGEKGRCPNFGQGGGAGGIVFLNAPISSAAPVPYNGYPANFLRGGVGARPAPIATAGQAGPSGNAGSAGSAGSAGNTGQASSGLTYNFAGGAGGNAGSAGNAGNGGTGGNGGGAACFPGPTCSMPGGAGGNGGGAGASGPTKNINWPGAGGCPSRFGGSGGGGAGVTNDGQAGFTACQTPEPVLRPDPNTRNCASNTYGAAGGTTSSFGLPVASTPMTPYYPAGIPSDSSGGAGGLGRSSSGKGFLGGPQFCTNPYGGYQASGPCGWSGGTQARANRCYGNTPGPVVNAINNTNPALRSGSGGGGGGGGPGGMPRGGGGGGGGGRGNAGNAGGTGGAGNAGSAGTPVTYNCVPVTPGSPYPITVGSPGGQVVISWNPQ